MEYQNSGGAAAFSAGFAASRKHGGLAPFLHKSKSQTLLEFSGSGIVVF
jgi:hypothetical protein